MVGIRVQRQVVHSQNIGCCSSYRFARGLREQRSNSCEKSGNSTTETIFAARDIWLQDVTREFWKKELIDRVYQQLAVRFLGRTSKNLQKTLELPCVVSNLACTHLKMGLLLFISDPATCHFAQRSRNASGWVNKSR
jgi:hypothetical protein